MKPEHDSPIRVAPASLPSERTQPMPPMPLTATPPARTEATAPLSERFLQAPALPFRATERTEPAPVLFEPPTPSEPQHEPRSPFVPPPPPRAPARAGTSLRSAFWMLLLALDLIVLGYLFVTWRLGR
jgi:hypothetical protein